jgi:hypothetical protein
MQNDRERWIFGVAVIFLTVPKNPVFAIRANGQCPCQTALFGEQQ